MDSNDDVNKKDLDKTVLFSDVSRNTASHPDDIFFYLENKQDKEMMIPEDKPVKVGRNPDQDFAVKDQTVSREHLILVRKKNDVHILVKGANGLVVDGYTYEHGEEVTIRPPKSFTIGGVTCGIRSDDTLILQRDDLATVIESIDDDHSSGRSPRQAVLPGNNIFDSYAKKEYRQQDFNMGHSSGKSLIDDAHQYSSFTMRPAHESFAPRIKLPGDRQQKDRQAQFLLFAGGAAVFLMIAVTTFIWKQYHSTDIADTYRENGLIKNSPYHRDKVVSQPDRLPAETGKNRYDKSLIDRAEILMQRKEWETARDYLLDIPINSIYYDQAREMIVEIGRMTEE